MDSGKKVKNKIIFFLPNTYKCLIYFLHHLYHHTNMLEISLEYKLGRV